MRVGMVADVIAKLQTLPPRTVIYWRPKVAPSFRHHLPGDVPGRSRCGRRAKAERLVIASAVTCQHCLAMLHPRETVSSVLRNKYKKES